jgi:hypothetical protein
MNMGPMAPGMFNLCISLLVGFSPRGRVWRIAFSIRKYGMFEC